VIAVAWPGPTVFVLVMVVAAWAVVAGLLAFFAAFRPGEMAGTRALIASRSAAVAGAARMAGQ
jgi:Short repeat of unknown function (DUF308)